MKVSVIVPIFKVEQFIEKCSRSLMAQTLQEVEYIFIDDASPDNSINRLQTVLDFYGDRNITIVRHASNKGLPAARNTGLALARGEYIFHCDSDDYVEPDMLEKMYMEAVRTDADIIWSDWFLTYSDSERYMKQPAYTSPYDALVGMLCGKMKYNVWNKLIRRSLYIDNDVKFPSGYGMGEDLTMLKLFCHAKKVSYLPKGFYHYVKLNLNAFSNTYSQRHLEELKFNAESAISYLIQTFGEVIEPYIIFFKQEIKFPFLITDSFEVYKRWCEWFPEANLNFFGNKDMSMRRRLLQWMAYKKQWWFIRLYYLVVYESQIFKIIKK